MECGAAGELVLRCRNPRSSLASHPLSWLGALNEEYREYFEEAQQRQGRGGPPRCDADFCNEALAAGNAVLPWLYAWATLAALRRQP